MDISVIIPFYDGNRYVDNLTRMIADNVSMLNGIATVEMIIVNDSPWIEVKHLINTDNYQTRVLRYSDNVGIHGARIRGVSEAKGQFILMLDQDDEIESDFLLETYSNIGNCDVAVANGELVRSKGNAPIYISQKRHNKINNLFYYVYLENRILSPGHCLVRKNKIPVEWMKEPMAVNGADDLLLWVLMLCKKCKFASVPKKLYRHIDTGENVSSDEMNMAKSTYEVCDVLSQIQYVPSWVVKVLYRKINNDVYYVNTGHDKYLDYKLIESIRKFIKHSRS